MAHKVEADGAEKNFFGKKDKNMKIKKLLAGIMSAVMVLGIMTFPTFAEETTNEFNIGTNQTYTKLSDAITAASDKGYAEVTYNIYGKVVADEGVDATNNVWLNVIGASDTTVKKINFVGKSEDAELNISQRKVVLALNGGSASADVSYTDLKLSKGECTGTNVQDLGHAANYFTTWLRCGDSANRTVTYTNCTFPNGSSNNQYGKTVYNNCTFNKDNDEQYALWVYTAADNGVTLGGAVEINGGEMKAARGVKTYSENSADAVANVTLKNIKIETTVKPAVVSSIAGNISFNNVTANKGLIYAERVNSAKNLAEVKINGNSVNYAAQVGNKYYVSVDDAKKNVTDESTIKVIAYAKVGETEYATLQEAINAAESNATVTLLCDTAESVVIGADKEITLDLNGKTLTNVEKQHTITNNGKLTVTDYSESKSGVVDNVSHGRAALFNDENATAVLNGAKFMRSKEAGTDDPYNNGKNSWYTIANKGTMTINADVTVENKGYFSSNIVNGYYDTVGTGIPTLTINGGTFTGGVKTVKVDECGVLTITGGTFTNEKYPCIMNWNKTEISGGTFTSPSSNSVFNGLFNNTTAVGSLAITGGAFEGGIINSEEYTGGNIAISDGTFSTDVSEYCVDGFEAVKGADGKYTVEKANWGKYTDSGCYVVNDTKYGMMRFMFAFTGDITGKTIQSYGIKYISAENIGKDYSDRQGVSATDGATAFQGDIVGIDYDTTNKANYYAAAYIDFGNGDIIWSAPLKCNINWNRTFTKYAPQTSENGGNE